jgi:transcriptional regulator GlxA family with amidase domain
VIDFCGPWEIFERVNILGRKYDAFHLYTVAETAAPITAAGGLKIVPNYTIANAPAPKIIVIPAQSPASEATKEWIRNATKSTDVTMSVCTGAFVLASTGLLSGKPATTHHGAYVDLAIQYPDIHVQRGARFVESGNLASARGLTSGMDLAMRVVERYFGRDVANQTASLLEYQGRGWLNSSSNAEYAGPIKQSADHLYAPSAAWKSNGLSPPLIRERHTTSVCKSTNESSMPHQKSSPQYDRYPRGKSMERPAPFPR